MDMTPGFYQGRQKGLKSGRVSPRDAIRPSRSDSIDAAHGIVSSGSVDPNQGQLFNLNQMPAIPQDELVRRAGGPPADPLANHKGFMPMLDTHKQKINALNRLADARTRTGVDRGTGAPIHEALTDVGAAMHNSSSGSWYAGTIRQNIASGVQQHPNGSMKGLPPAPQANKDWIGKAPRQLVEGEAGKLIEDVAARHGVSHFRVARAVAITSPQTHWDEENAGPVGHSGGLSRPNLNAAEHLISTVNRLKPDASPIDVERAAGGVHSMALGTMVVKAGREYAKGEPQQKIPVSGKASAKVPNFEQSLALGHPSKAVQAQAARSSTVDVHAVHSMGGDEKMLKTAPGYAAAAMVIRRAAHKAGELAPIGQSLGWGTQRGSETATSMGHDRLFINDRHGMRPNPRALTDPASMRRSMSDGRSPQAKKMGIEF